MKKYIIAVCCPIILSACGNNTTAKTPPPEYVSQQIKADFAYSNWKGNKQEAMNRIHKKSTYHAKSACHAIGYGWSFSKVINPGNVSCEIHPTTQRTRCREEHLVLECSRIKPGSVGMGMIPFTQ